jgi:hypothetical protein
LKIKLVAGAKVVVAAEVMPGAEPPAEAGVLLLGAVVVVVGVVDVAPNRLVGFGASEVAPLATGFPTPENRETG